MKTRILDNGDVLDIYFYNLPYNNKIRYKYKRKNWGGEIINNKTYVRCADNSLELHAIKLRGGLVISTGSLYYPRRANLWIVSEEKLKDIEKIIDKNPDIPIKELKILMAI